MAEDMAGQVWLGTYDGFLLRVEGDGLVDETSRTLKVPKPIRALYAGEDGSLWIGYAGLGIGRLKAGRFVAITTADGLHDGYVSQMVADDRGWVW